MILFNVVCSLMIDCFFFLLDENYTSETTCPLAETSSKYCLIIYIASDSPFIDPNYDCQDGNHRCLSNMPNDECSAKFNYKIIYDD